MTIAKRCVYLEVFALSCITSCVFVVYDGVNIYGGIMSIVLMQRIINREYNECLLLREARRNKQITRKIAELCSNIKRGFK